MKIFSSEQIKAWDAYTVENDNITSLELMEYAAVACSKWIVDHKYHLRDFMIFCGTGNNGGDGLAIARILMQNHFNVSVHIVSENGSANFQANLERLQTQASLLPEIMISGNLPAIPPDIVVIDALLGIGLNRPPTGIYAEIIDHVNNASAPVISIDMPSGLLPDAASEDNKVIKATHTLTFQNYKLAFLLEENEKHCGEIHLLNIGLSKDFEINTNTAFEITERSLVRSIAKERNKFSHKGNYGHAALLCGSYGMMGAAVLAARSCMRSGVGKLTCFVPECGYEIMQLSLPEAMCKVCGKETIESCEGFEYFNAAGIGPGLGTRGTQINIIKELFTKTQRPLLLDADALNILANNKELIDQIPPLSIITPHPKEFSRLFGESANDFERLQLALRISANHKIYVVLKGHYTFISTPEGKGWFNDTGNPGMATGGSGDVLSGFITGLLAQGYAPVHAALFGVYMHGLAGDVAAQKYSQQAMLAGDIADSFGDAFKLIM